MLFKSTVPGLLRKLSIQSDSHANLERKKRASKALDYYYGNHLVHLDELLSKFFSQPDRLQKSWLNIVKKIVNNQAQVYNEPPVRTIDGSEKDRQTWAYIAQGCALDVRLKQAQRLTKLCKTVLIRVLWRSGKIAVDIITPNIVDVECWESPEELKRVLVTDYGKAGGKTQEVEYSLWDVYTYQRLDYRGNVKYSQDNDYGVIPFVPVWDYAPHGSEFFLSGNEDLMALQEAINVRLVDLCHLIQMSSFGISYLKTASAGGASVRLDPGSLLELGLEDEVGAVNQQACIDEVVKAIDKIVKWACVSHGLSAASMSTDPTEASGLSKIVDRTELDEQRRDDIALWRSYEHQLFDLIRIVHNIHSPTKLSESATLQIDFADVAPKTETQVWNDLLAMGVISPIDIAMERNKDLTTREEALSYLLQLQEETRLLTESQPPA